ncbi:hypothetical protein D3C75_771110 [compost metagenome]
MHAPLHRQPDVVRRHAAPHAGLGDGQHEGLRAAAQNYLRLLFGEKAIQLRQWRATQRLGPAVLEGFDQRQDLPPALPLAAEHLGRGTARAVQHP